MSKNPAGSYTFAVNSILPVYLLQGLPPETEVPVPPTEHEIVIAIVGKNIEDKDACFSKQFQQDDQDILLQDSSIENVRAEKGRYSPGSKVATAPAVKQEPSIKSEPCQTSQQAFKGRIPTDASPSDDEDIKIKLETQDPAIWQDDADRSSPPPFAKRKQPATSALLNPQKKKRNPPGCAKGSRKRRRRTVPEPRRCCGCGEIDICSAWVTNCGHRLCYECYTEIKIEAEEEEEGKVCPECEGQIKWFQCKP